MPFVLHGAWLRAEGSFPDGSFFLWGEDSTFQEGLESTDSPLGTGGEVRRHQEVRLRTTKPLSHPTQMSAGELRLQLLELFPLLTAKALKLTSTRVWLPTAHNTPLSHGQILQHQLAGANFANGNQQAVHLQAWQITGLALAPFMALRILCHLDAQTTDERPSQRMFTPMRLGNDLLFWSNAAKFTLQLLASQHYLPTLRPHTANQLRAAWQPFLSDPQMERQFEQLTESMPPVCRAYQVANLSEAPPATELLNSFVSTFLDTAVRQWGAAQITPAPTAAGQGYQWLAGLVSADSFLHLPPQTAFQLYQHWRSWSDQLHALHHAHVRVCFQLEAPTDTPSPAIHRQTPTWTLHYYLQARNNLDLRMSAAEIWRSQQQHVQLGARTLDQPQERLLAGLQVAARLSAPIGRSLQTPKPESAQLTTEEAHQFLRETAPMLESSGFGVILPDWWQTNQRARLGLRLRLQGNEPANGEPTNGEPTEALQPTRRQRLDPIRYDWELMLGNRVLSEGEFERLAAIHSPLVKLNGQWVELDPNQIQIAQRFLNQQRPGGLVNFLRALRIAQTHRTPSEQPTTIDGNRATQVGESPMAEDVTPPQGDPVHALASLLSDEMAALLPVVSVDVEGWLATALEQLNHHQPFTALAEPADFIGELRPYQQRGVGWLVYLRGLGIGACLADDMGLGKTVQSIALLLYVREFLGETVPALLICPTSVVANWRREVERFAPKLRVLVHHGNTRLGHEAFLEQVQQYDLIITSYGTARRDIDFLSSITWSDLILDEAQNIKNPTAKQTQAAMQLNAHNRIALTGTPVENRLSELWSIMEFLNPGYLEYYELFRRRYIIPVERYNDETQAKELRKLVQPFLLRRLKSDPAIIADLPEKNEMVVYCSLTQEQADLYEKVVSDTLAALDRSEGIQRRGIVLGLLTKLKQICNHPAHFLKQAGPLPGRSSKLNRLTEMLEEVIAVGDSALVFTQFVEMGQLLQKHLIETFKVETIFLHGRTPAIQRERMVVSFQESESPIIFILSLRAGGAGLNLTHANHVFHFDRWWNPAVENQATDRAFRIGQRRDVQVHKFVVAGTLEEHIHQLLEDKRTLSEVIVGSGEHWLTELSTDQLRDLLLLHRDLAEEE